MTGPASDLFGIDPDFETPDNKVYLAYEWTEEREGKNHVGIYSTPDKAKAACQGCWDDHNRDLGVPLASLQWSLALPTEWVGEKVGQYDADYPFSVEEFNLDTVHLVDPSNPNVIKTVHL